MERNLYPHAFGSSSRSAGLSLLLFSILVGLLLLAIFLTDGKFVGLLFVAGFEVPFLFMAIRWLLETCKRFKCENSSQSRG